MYNNLIFQKSTSGIPTTGFFGGASLGDRIIYQPSSSTTDYPCAIGIDLTNNNMWYSLSSNFSNSFYFGGTKTLDISSNVIRFPNGVINCSNLQQGGQNITTISSNIVINQTPNVQKRFLIEFTCNTPILMPNSVNYFKRDIDLRLYTQTQTIPNPSSLFRAFSTKIWIKSRYVEYNVNGNYNVLQYTIYQSLQSQNGSPFGSAGENLHAIGFPPSPTLNTITGGQISLVRTGNFNFLSVLSVANNTVIQMIISDELF